MQRPQQQQRQRGHRHQRQKQRVLELRGQPGLELRQRQPAGGAAQPGDQQPGQDVEFFFAAHGTRSLQQRDSRCARVGQGRAPSPAWSRPHTPGQHMRRS
ncbi:MAG TPA: hypothetical protein VFS21_37275 [Roseiflexaceae bacterium]|nr:hypothetical protein [Roseiflexaceae bacterium]